MRSLGEQSIVFRTSILHKQNRSTSAWRVDGVECENSKQIKAIGSFVLNICYKTLFLEVRFYDTCKNLNIHRSDFLVKQSRVSKVLNFRII